MLKNPEYVRYFFNTSWMLGDKLVVLFLGLVASVVLARYYGPEEFGFYSYAVSLSALVGTVAHLGLAGLAVKEIKQAPQEENRIVSSIFLLKFIGAVVALIIVVLVAASSTGQSAHFWTLLLIGLTVLTRPFEIFDLFFQAKVKAKYGVLARFWGVGLGNIAKIAIAIGGLSIVAAAGAHFFAALITAFILFGAYRRYTGDWPQEVSMQTGLQLLKKGAWIFVGSLSAVVYLKVDQVMLKHMLGEAAVGQYAAAASLSETWYFIPVTVMASIMPKLVDKKAADNQDYRRFIQLLLDVFWMAGVFLSAAVALASDWIVQILYGGAYEQAAEVLSIHIFASAFIFMRSVLSKWIILEELFAISLLTQGAGAVCNVVLNLLFIPRFGVLGAAYATLIAYALASYISLLFNRKTRPMFYMMSKSLLFHGLKRIRPLRGRI